MKSRLASAYAAQAQKIWTLSQWESQPELKAELQAYAKSLARTADEIGGQSTVKELNLFKT